VHHIGSSSLERRRIAFSSPQLTPLAPSRGELHRLGRRQAMPLPAPISGDGLRTRYVASSRRRTNFFRLSFWNARRSQSNPLPDHHPQDVAGQGAQRHPDAD